MTADLAARLARLDTCGVSDALDRLGLQGAVLGLRPMWPCPRIAGQVITVRLRRAEHGEHAPRHLGTAAIEAGGPGTVIVIEHHDREDAAGWEAALREIQHQATHLESRGAIRAAVTLYDAIRIARAGGLNCEHQTRI